VLFVSHNMAAVQALCQRGIFLRNGTLSKDASATEAIGIYLQTLEQDASQDLLERTERSGKGEVKLRRVDISTDDADCSNTLATGRPARFVFHFTQALPKMSCMFTIYDHLGQPVTHFNSDVHSPADSRDSMLGLQFTCQLDELLLVPGRYRINAAITSDGQLQDHVEAATFFDVEQGPVKGRPVTAGTGYGSVFLHHRWTHPTSTLR
jgi:lipopolysaccharide transport system ATP-binding protein